MRRWIAAIAAASLVSCATPKKAALGTGIGVTVVGLGFVASSEQGSTSDTVNAGIPFWIGGATMVVVSLASYFLYYRDRPALQHERPDVHREELPEGAVIRAEGSSCTGELDRCAQGLRCETGVCRP